MMVTRFHGKLITSRAIRLMMITVIKANLILNGNTVTGLLIN